MWERQEWERGAFSQRGEKKKGNKMWDGKPRRKHHQHVRHLCGQAEVLGLQFWPLTFSFTKTQELKSFPISLRDKSCSDIQHAETKGAVSTKNFFPCSENFKREILRWRKNRQNKRSGSLPSVHNYAWGLCCSWNTHQPTIILSLI